MEFALKEITIQKRELQKKCDEAEDTSKVYKNKLSKLEQKCNSLLADIQNNTQNRSNHGNNQEEMVMTERKKLGKSGNKPSQFPNKPITVSYSELKRTQCELDRYKKICEELEENRTHVNKYASDILDILGRENLNFNEMKDSIESCVEHILLYNGDRDSSMSVSRSLLANKREFDELKDESLNHGNDKVNK